MDRSAEPADSVDDTRDVGRLDRTGRAQRPGVAGTADHARAGVQAAALALLVALALGAGLTACGDSGGKATPTPAPSASQSPFDPALEKQLESAMSAAVERTGAPGAIVGIWAPGKGSWIHSEGVADMAMGDPITADDHVRIASNTKSFTATAVCLLAEQDKLSLDDTVSKYYPGVPEITNGKRITIRQLLNMTSGYFSFTGDKGFVRDFTADPTMTITPQQEISISNKHKPVFAPGASYYYSDANYTVLGLIIEEVTGEPAIDVVTRLVIEPLGLTDTSFPSGNDLPEPYCDGYFDKQGRLLDYTALNPRIPWTGGGMVSNLEDLRTWAKANATGRLLSPAMQKEHLGWVDIPGQRLDVRYGLGIMYVAGFVGYHGAIFGYNSLLAYLPEEDATVVVVANKSSNSSEETFDIFFSLVHLLWPERLTR